MNAPATRLATINAISTHLGNRIRQEREDKGILQKDICEILGVSLPTYRALEAGKTSVSTALLIATMVELGISDALLAS